MLSTSGNNNSLNTGTANSNSNNNNQTNLLGASSLSNDFMLPTINNITTNGPMATSYLNDYKLYRDVVFQQQQQQQHPSQASIKQPSTTATQQQQQSNLIGNNLVNSTLNNIVVNSINSLSNKPPQQQQTQQQLMGNSDFLIYLNRCNQFLELNLYQQALDEINHALNLVSNSALARYRKAQALLGLKRYYDCEKELWNCINLEPTVLEYRKELLKVKQLALMSLNLNLDHNIILIAAQKYDTIREAIDGLTWHNSINSMDFNYSNSSAIFQPPNPQPSVSSTNNSTNNNSITTNSDNGNLINGWNLSSNTVGQQSQVSAQNRFGSINQLMTNGNNLLFNNGLMTNNLLLNTATSIVNRGNNNGTLNAAVTSTAATGQQQANNILKSNSTSINNTNNLVNSNNSSNTAITAQSSVSSIAVSTNPTIVSNSSPSSDLTNHTNGLTNGQSRFNYLLRGLEHPLLSAASITPNQQSTNGLNSANQNNLINNQQSSQQQQQLYSRILPSFIDNSMTNGVESKSGQQSIASSTRTLSQNLSTKLNLNDNTSSNLLTNGLLMMNNNSAPSPICSMKLSNSDTSTATNNPNNNNHSNNSNNNNQLNGNGTASLTNSCNFNIFNQMPEMKLIETIVPNLMGSLGSASPLINSAATNSDLTSNTADPLINHNNNNNNINDLTQSTGKLASSLIGQHKELNNHKENRLINSLMNNLTVSPPPCSTLDLKKNTVKEDAGLLINSLTSLPITPKDIQAPIKCETIIDNQTSLLNNQPICSPVTSITSSSNNNNVSTLIGSTPPATSSLNQCTSYSDIVKRAKKINNQQSNGLNTSVVSKESSISSSSKTDCESTVDDSITSKRPTNLWGYNGLRVANVSLTASKATLTSLFSKFGRIRLLERIVNKTTTNNIWVYFDNSVSPVDAVTKLQNTYIEGISVDADTPLRLYFAPTDDQKDLKFSRPKQPPDNKGECYYWRTTNCFSKEQCPLLHLQANKNIDAQVWMRVNPENAETAKGDDEESNNQNGADNEATTES